MSKNSNMTRLSIFGALVVAGGCTTAVSDDGSAGGGGGGASTTTVPESGRFSGTYEVPVPVELASAAVFSVPEIDWAIENGVAKLDYDLPLGLVGKQIHLSFEGPFTAGSGTVSLAGAAGTADCEITLPIVSCTE